MVPLEIPLPGLGTWGLLHKPCLRGVSPARLQASVLCKHACASHFLHFTRGWQQQIFWQVPPSFPHVEA